MPLLRTLNTAACSLSRVFSVRPCRVASVVSGQSRWNKLDLGKRHVSGPRVAASPLPPSGQPRALDDDDDKILDAEIGNLVAIDALAPAASSYHNYTGENDFDALEEEDSPYDYEFPENRALGEALKPSYKKASGTFSVLQRLAVIEKGGDNQRGDTHEESRSAGRRQRKPWFHFGDDMPVRVRVLDVDAIPLQDLHRAFMHTLVRRRPAEVCIYVASRLAVFRDNYKHQTYESMLRDCGRVFGPIHGPELLALFARCHATIAVPYMIDYTRRFGQFSRAFIAGQVERSLRPALFDFLRYEKKGGLRPLPPMVARPWALSTYTRIMTKSSVKRCLYDQLQKFGHIPPSELSSDTAKDLPIEARVDEQLSAAGALRVSAPKPQYARGTDVHRPKLLEAIMEAEYSGVGWDAQAQSAKARHDNDNDDDELFDDGQPHEGDDDLRDRFSTQFEHVVPDDTFDLGSKDALVDASRLRSNGRGEVLEEDLALPGRWWGSTRRMFFRHQHKAYRMIGDSWQTVPDPRGPRYKPKRRHKPHSLKREDRLKYSMQGTRLS